MLPLPCKVPEYMLELAPQYRGRVMAAWPGMNIDISGYNRHLTHVAVQQTAGPQGGRANLYNGTSAYSHCRPINTESQSGSGTMIVRYMPLSTTTGRAMIGQNRASVAQFGLRSNTVQHYGRTIAAGAYTGTTLDGWKTVVASIGKFPGGVGQRAMESYEKGKRVGGGDAIDQPAGGYAAATANFSVCGVTTNNSTWSTFYNAILDLVVILDYKMPEAEMAMISLDPLRLFQLRMPYYVKPKETTTGSLGHVYPSTGATAANGSPTGSLGPWTNPTRIVSDNASEAQFSSAGGNPPSPYLKATGFDFSSLPANASITGIEVKINRRTDITQFNPSAVGVCDNVVRLARSGVLQGENKATGTTWPTSLTVATYGGQNDLWKTGFNPTQLRANTLEVWLSCTILEGNSDYNVYAGVDSITAKVYYTTPSAGGTNYNYSLSEGMVLSDTRSPTVQVTVSGSDGFIASDTRQATISAMLAVSDGLKGSDAAAPTSQVRVAASDGGRWSDSGSSVRGVIVGVSDGYIVSDSQSNVLAVTTNSSDGFILSDTQTTQLGVLSQVADGLTISDTISNQLSVNVSLADHGLVSDTATVNTQVSVSSNDGLVIGDTSPQPTLQVLASLTDGLVVSDTPSALKEIMFFVADGMIVSDSRTIRLDALNSVSDGLKYSDLQQNNISVTVLTTDSCIYSDSPNAGLFVAIAFSDSYIVSDTSTTQRDAVVSASDSFLYSDAPVTRLDVLTLITDGYKWSELFQLTDDNYLTGYSDVRVNGAKATIVLASAKGRIVVSPEIVKILVVPSSTTSVEVDSSSSGVEIVSATASEIIVE